LTFVVVVVVVIVVVIVAVVVVVVRLEYWNKNAHLLFIDMYISSVY